MTAVTREGMDVQPVADPELDDPAMIEGLPGVGHVGKLAAEHLLEEEDGTLLRRITSEHFPPQVSIDSDSVATLPVVEVHHVSVDGRDVLTVTGDHQAMTPMGHYRLAGAILDIAESFAVERVFALGGVPTGEMQEEPAVIGAVSDKDLAPDLDRLGVSFREREPAGGVVGVSGLLLGLGQERDLDVACLMGETGGYLVDPRSAQAVLEVLEQAIGFSLGYERLESRAEDMKQVVRRLQEMEETNVTGEEDLRYIG